MSIFSMKLKGAAGASGKQLLAIPLQVVAIHDHKDARECSVHLQDAKGGTVDLVLREDDRDDVLKAIAAGTVAVGRAFVLRLVG